jgi:hypothetical protein
MSVYYVVVRDPGQQELGELGRLNRTASQRPEPKSERHVLHASRLGKPHRSLTSTKCALDSQPEPTRQGRPAKLIWISTYSHAAPDIRSNYRASGRPALIIAESSKVLALGPLLGSHWMKVEDSTCRIAAPPRPGSLSLGDSGELPTNMMQDWGFLVVSQSAKFCSTPYIHLLKHEACSSL